MSTIHDPYLEDPSLNAPGGFGASLIQYLEDLAGRRSAAMGKSFSGSTRANVEALERLAYHLPELDEIRDRRIAILAAVNSAFAEVRRVERIGGVNEGEKTGTRRTKFEEPTSTQTGILQRLAEFGLENAPSSDQTLTDLAAAGVCDLVAKFGKLTDRERGKASALTKQVEKLEAALEANRVDRGALTDTRAELEAAQAELATQAGVIEELRGMVAAFEPKRPRRRMIEPGIYRTGSGGLEVAEATGKGKTKFHAVDSLGEARLLRDELANDPDHESDGEVT